MISCIANKILVAKLRKTGHLVASEAHGSCKRTSVNLLLIFKRNSRLRPGKFDGSKLIGCNRPQTCFCLLLLCQTNSENEIKLSRAFEKFYPHKTLRQSCFWLKCTRNISRRWHFSLRVKCRLQWPKKTTIENFMQKLFNQSDANKVRAPHRILPSNSITQSALAFTFWKDIWPFLKILMLWS